MPPERLRAGERKTVAPRNDDDTSEGCEVRVLDAPLELVGTALPYEHDAHVRFGGAVGGEIPGYSGALEARCGRRCSGYDCLPSRHRSSGEAARKDSSDNFTLLRESTRFCG